MHCSTTVMSANTSEKQALLLECDLPFKPRPLPIATSNETSKKVRFSAVVEFIQSETTFSDQSDSTWWSDNDFRIFRVQAKSDAHVFWGESGKVTIIDDALMHSRKYAAILGMSDRMPSEKLLADIVRRTTLYSLHVQRVDISTHSSSSLLNPKGCNLSSSGEWESLRGLETLASASLKSHCVRSKLNQMANVNFFGKRSPEILRCVLEQDSHVSRIFARILGCADAQACHKIDSTEKSSCG